MWPELVIIAILGIAVLVLIFGPGKVSLDTLLTARVRATGRSLNKRTSAQRVTA